MEKLLLVLIIFQFKHDYVESECCPAPCKYLSDYEFYEYQVGLCDDCTHKTPYCGYGSCNIFGCNCDGGCRQGIGCANCRSKRSIDEHHEVLNNTSKHYSEKHLDKIFADFDRNKNGVLEFSEAQKWVLKNHRISKREAPNYWAEFLILDTNKDGKLAPHEIDN